MEWIKDKNPKANKKVLVFTSDHQYEVTSMYWNSRGEKEWDVEPGKSVVAWTPIIPYC